MFKSIYCFFTNFINGDGLAKNTIIYTMSIVLNKSIGFFLIPIYTRYFSVGEYGIISLLAVVAQISQFIFLFGVSSSAMRFYFDFQDEESRKKVYGNALLLLLILPLILFIILTPIISVVWNRFITSIPFSPLVFIVILSSFFSPLGLLLLGLFRVQKRAVAYMIYSVSSFILLVTFNIIAIVILRKGIIGQLYAQLIVQVIYFFIAFYYLFKYSHIKYSWPMVKSIVTYGIPLLPFFIFAWLDNSSIRILLERYCGLEVVGIFSLSSQFVGILTIFGAAMDNAFLPFFFETAGGKDGCSTLGIFSLKYITLLGVMILIVALVAEPLILSLTTPKYHEAIVYIPFLLLSSMYIFIFRIFNWSLMYSKRTGVLSAITGLSVFLLILFLILFLKVWSFGIWGAIISLNLVGIIRVLIGYSISRRFYAIKFRWLKMSFILLILLIGLSLIGFIQYGYSFKINLLIKIIAFIVSASYLIKIAGFKGIKGFSFKEL